MGGTTDWTQEDTWTSLSALLDAFQRTVVVKQPAKRTPLSTTPGSSDHLFLNLAPVPLALLSHLRHQLQQQRQADVEQHMLQLGRQRWIRCFPCPLAHSERLIVAMGPLQDFMAAEAARLEREGEVAAAKCLLAVAVWWAHGPCSSDIQVNKKTLLKAALHLRVVAREATCDALPAVLGLPHSWCEVWSKLYPTLTDQPARSMARHLLRSGWLLSTATGSLDEFWWSLPGCGPFIRAVTNGRKAVVAAVRVSPRHGIMLFATRHGTPLPPCPRCTENSICRSPPEHTGSSEGGRAEGHAPVLHLARLRCLGTRPAPTGAVYKRPSRVPRHQGGWPHPRCCPRCVVLSALFAGGRVMPWLPAQPPGPLLSCL